MTVELGEHALLRELLAPIRTLMADPSVSEVMINGPYTIFAERAGRIEATTLSFPSVEALRALLTSIAQLSGKRFDRTSPILEGHMPDGSRVQAVGAPAATHGPIVSIRRFTSARLDLDALATQGALSMEAKHLLEACIEERRNILVSGGTGSGKTSLLNALSARIAPHERVALIEEVPELQLGARHVIALETLPADALGRGAITTRALFRACLRLRPDRIVIGEIRGAEAIELIQAMTSGHRGCLSTLHASHPTDALARLETMALMGELSLPLSALREQIGSAVDLIVQVERLASGARVVSHLTEVRSGSAAGYVTRALYTADAPAHAPKAAWAEGVPEP